MAADAAMDVGMSPVMLAQHPTRPRAAQPAQTASPRYLRLLALLLAALLSGCAPRALERTGPTAAAFEVRGRIALVEADIALAELRSDGTAIPRVEWGAAARLLYAQAAREVLGRQAIATVDHGAVASGGPGGGLHATATAVPAAADDARAASLRAEMTQMSRATGADYGLFTHLRGSHATRGRAALRAAGRLLVGGDMGGDTQEAEAWLVELRSGQVVWRNRTSGPQGDLRTLEGARRVAATLLAGLHGPAPAARH